MYTCENEYICDYKWTQAPQTDLLRVRDDFQRVSVWRAEDIKWYKQGCWDLKSGVNGVGWVRYGDNHVATFVLEVFPAPIF